MVNYTRRHFQDIAALIASVPKNRRNAEIEKYCNLFAADNPRFDRKKFAAACGVTNPKTLGKFAGRFKQSDLSGECWAVQFQGKEACKKCEFRGTKECGGKNIIKTGKTTKGKSVPLKSR